ncbi:MAG: ABC transporter ATP-binding protein [Candidatus Microsaccharimonas sp.]
MLQVSNLRKEFSQGGHKIVAVDDVSFLVNDGEFASIIGRSGSGKSTLLGLLGALDSPTAGSIKIDDSDIATFRDYKLTNYRRDSIGFVFQNYNLVPNLTALENVMLPLEFAKVDKHTRKTRAAKLLEQVGISGDKQMRKPGKLSGGEQQRVSIARALANKPRLILADEPTGNLDTENGTRIFDLLHDLARTEKTTIVVVTHDLEIAGKTDKVFKLQDGKLTTQPVRR